MMNKRRTGRLPLPAVIILVAVLLLAVSSIITFKTTPQKTKRLLDVGTVVEADFQDDGFESKGRWYGLCRKNSIRSIDDFHRAVSEDQTLRVHFANFRWEKARMERLDKPMLAYVYFRKDRLIFRKETPIKLPAGDQYIVDGIRRVRTHCCNDFVEGPPLVDSNLSGNPPPESSLQIASSSSETPTSAGPLPPSPTSQPASPSSLPASPSSASPSWLAGGMTKIGDVLDLKSAPPRPVQSLSGPDPIQISNEPPVTPVIPITPVTPVTPVSEPETISLVGLGILALFIAFFFENHNTHKRKTRGQTR